VDGSRQNELHARLAVEAAQDLLDDVEELSDERPVAIVTPYRAQARLIWRSLRDARLERRVDVGTVHRFQGLERQAIVFDTVEAAPERPAPFMRGGYGSESMRLINVAITRAQSRLVIVADTAHLRRALPRDATLLGLVGLLKGYEDS
jgi:superfamily I DNA and/or RNA helicase